MHKSFLEVKQLQVLNILHNINFQITQEKVVYIVGPNGSGKSMLLKAITGVVPSEDVKSGQIFFKGKDITSFAPEKRAKMGMFLAWQKPPAIPEITVEDYFKAISNKMKSLEHVKQLLKQVNLPQQFAKKPLNYEMSGGQIKKLELATMLLLKPSLILLDELDSGLDVESMSFVFQKIKEYLQKNEEARAIVVTHTFNVQKILEPDVVYTMNKGQLSGPFHKDILQKIQQVGFDFS